MENLSADQYNGRSQQMSGEFGAAERDAKKSETATADALAELYRLLNDYAPLWYTERHHQRAENVLRMLGKL
jgi:hypothetical protein